jgi:hypothetical protein
MVRSGRGTEANRISLKRRPWAVCDESERWSWRATSTSAAPVPFAGLESNANAFGYLPQCLEMRDSGLLGRPRSNDAFLAIWLDGFNPIGMAERNDPVVFMRRSVTGPTRPMVSDRRDQAVPGGPGAQAPSLRPNRLIGRRLWCPRWVWRPSDRCEQVACRK